MTGMGICLEMWWEITVGKLRPDNSVLDDSEHDCIFR